ncbi:glycerol kinase GlpK [Candidatus Poribacteria bacterium]|jgi:glycerol kinase|nr:glycerol kinase GlpK [Candidatus Poribacteria bacterium]MBT7809387.1 glycerol kinase GlpK [Candidatus Poribacteria bacterium]
MATQRYVLGIDAGTTGVTAALIDTDGRIAASATAEFPQYYPRPGWVEHDADEIWTTTARVTAELLEGAPPAEIASIGITNQRETAVVWDRTSGRPIHNAIVWQCRRTAARCEALRDAGHEPAITATTGLVADPYFSGPKIAWLLDTVPGARQRADALAFGTVDSWLIWNLTGGRAHVTDFTNASRTMLLDIERRAWDDDMLALLDVPRAVLPDVAPSRASFGVTRSVGFLPDGLPIGGVAGDQQSALYGQTCFDPGDVKNTYGTGCFLLMQAGDERPQSEHGLLTTLACAADGSPAYALEGSVFVAGAVVQWLRDELAILDTAADSEALAASVADTGGVTFVPAFTGLGSPYWDADARGGIHGLTRGTTQAHIVRAALEGIAHSSADVVEAMQRDIGARLSTLRVDGGASANDFLMQFQADVLDVEVVRPQQIETTVLGAAYLAGLDAGMWSPDDLRSLSDGARRFTPTMPATNRAAHRRAWADAVGRVRWTPSQG